MGEVSHDIILTREEEATLLAVKAVIDGRVAIMVKPAGCPEHDAYAAGATPASVNSLIEKGVLRVRKMLNGRLLYIK